MIEKNSLPTATKPTQQYGISFWAFKQPYYNTEIKKIYRLLWTLLKINKLQEYVPNKSKNEVNSKTAIAA